MNFALKTRNCVAKSHENEEFGIKITENEEFCINDDEFCTDRQRGHDAGKTMFWMFWTFLMFSIVNYGCCVKIDGFL